MFFRNVWKKVISTDRNSGLESAPTLQTPRSRTTESRSKAKLTFSIRTLRLLLEKLFGEFAGGCESDPQMVSRQGSPTARPASHTNHSAAKQGFERTFLWESADTASR